jgi:hypothetical protein
MLFLLSRLSASYFCKQSILIVKNTPETFEGPLGDGDRLCINSTFPYLAVAFQQTTLLKVRYHSLDRNSQIRRTSGSFYVPSEIAAIGFGDSIGHVEVQALLPGIVSLSTFAFPSDCARNRYLTTAEDDSFKLATRLGLGGFADTITAAACVWSPHPRTAFIGVLDEESKNSVQVCGESGCRTAWLNSSDDTKRGTVEFSATEFLRIDANRPDFVGDYEAEISVKQAANFLPAAGKFDPDQEADTVPLKPRAEGDQHPAPVEDVHVPPAAPAAAEPEGAATLMKALHRGRGRKPSGLRTVLSVLQIVCLTVVSIGVIVCIVNLVANKGFRDDAESGLLAHGAPGAGPLSRFAGILPHAVPWGAFPHYGGLYQPPAGFVYPHPSGPVGFPAAQFPQTPEGPLQTGVPQQPTNA